MTRTRTEPTPATAVPATDPVVPAPAWAAEAPAGASARYLLGRLALLERVVADEVERRRAPAAASDPYLGLYVSDDQVDELLASGIATPIVPSRELAVARAGLEEQADALERSAGEVRLRQLARRFALDATDEELLVAAAAPEVDARFVALYGYLNDDVTLRHATVGLALRLAGLEPASAAARARLGAAGALVRSGLVRVLEPERPLLSRSVRVPDRVVAHVLGGDDPDELVAPLLVPAVASTSPTVAAVARALAGGASLVHIRDVHAAGGEAAAVAALAEVGRGALPLDLRLLAPDADLRAVATAAAREAGLRDAGVVAGPLDVLAELGAHAVRAFADAPATVVLVGRSPWDPNWSRKVPVAFEAERVGDSERDRLWTEALGEVPTDVSDLARTTASFRLTPLQIERAARAARQQATAAGRAVVTDDLQRGVRAQNAAGLQRLARRIEPRVGWDDLVLPARVEAQLRELPMRWRFRDRVLEDWGMGRGVATGRGVSALFAGDSGTGKTLAAEVIAGDLGLDLYLVDLSTVVDKYIGETSKNLERIFDEADRVNGVLLFDEADALFGKRSAVSDAKDRHANVEVAFLLQRMETFDGVAILTTNLATNLDDAFLRRLDSIVDFPSPDETQRRALWLAKLGGGVPHDDDVDVDELARLFTLSGSEITNVVVSAAYHAAERGAEVTMRDLVEAAVREHRKIGRHLTPADLGRYADALGTEA